MCPCHLTLPWLWVWTPIEGSPVGGVAAPFLSPHLCLNICLSSKFPLLTSIKPVLSWDPFGPTCDAHYPATQDYIESLLFSARDLPTPHPSSYKA